MRNGEVPEVRRGVRRSLSAPLRPARRGVVQAGHGAELLLGGPSLGSALRDQEVPVRPEVRVGGDAGGQWRDGR